MKEQCTRKGCFAQRTEGDRQIRQIDFRFDDGTVLNIPLCLLQSLRMSGKRSEFTQGKYFINQKIKDFIYETEYEVI